MFGLNEMEGDAGFSDRYFSLNSADLVAPRMEAWHLLWDFRVLKDVGLIPLSLGKWSMPDNGVRSWPNACLILRCCNIKL